MTRYNDHQLKLYKAEKLGVLDPALAVEVHKYATTVRTMTAAEKRTVLAALEAVSKR